MCETLCAEASVNAKLKINFYSEFMSAKINILLSAFIYFMDIVPLHMKWKSKEIKKAKHMYKYVN